MNERQANPQVGDWVAIMGITHALEVMAILPGRYNGQILELRRIHPETLELESGPAFRMEKPDGEAIRVLTTA